MISEKGFYGMSAGILTTSLLQPFETIKMALMLPPADLKLGQNQFKNISLAGQYIIRVNGYKGLYQGLIAAASKAGLGCYIYFTILRALQREKQKPLRDFFVSSFARVASTFFTNALSIIETRWELANFHRYKTILGAIVDIYKKQGFQGYFSGALTSCLKQGFFAGFYYMLYEELKEKGLGKFTAGILSGVVSTAITHPFELIRAKLQTKGIYQQYDIKDRNLRYEINSLIRSGEWFKGVIPRLLKKPLANTMTFLFFELIEQQKNKAS